MRWFDMDRKPSLEIQLRLRRAFLAHGFRELTMGGIAQACGFTRRNLYFYFSSKEEVFRSSVAFLNEDNAARALAAGRALFEKGASATDVLTEILYVRYGVFRRELSVSPHAVELNTEAFRLCRDIMNETAASFAKAVAGVIGELARDGRLSLREEFTAAQIAQMLLEGARGTNPADLDALVDVIVKMGRLAQDLHDVVAEIDCNPLLVRPRGAVALDALVVTK